MQPPERAGHPQVVAQTSRPSYQAQSGQIALAVHPDDLPGALALLQEAGDAQAVLQMGGTALESGVLPPQDAREVRRCLAPLGETHTSTLPSATTLFCKGTRWCCLRCRGCCCIVNWRCLWLTSIRTAVRPGTVPTDSANLNSTNCCESCFVAALPPHQQQSQLQQRT